MRRGAFFTDIDVEKALKKNRIEVDLQFYGDRRDRRPDGSDASGALSINLGKFLRNPRVYEEQSEKRDRANSYINTNVTASGLDISFDSYHEVFCVNKKEYIEVEQDKDSGQSEGRFITIPANSTVSVNTRERICLDAKTCAIIQSGVGNVSFGLSHISTTIDPGWEGPLLITFTNLNSEPYRFYHAEKLGTVVFGSTLSSRERPIDNTVDRNNKRWRDYEQIYGQNKKKERTVAFLTFFLPLIIFLTISIVSVFALSDGFSKMPYAIPTWDQVFKISGIVGFLLAVHLVFKRYYPTIETQIRIAVGKYFGVF